MGWRSEQQASEGKGSLGGQARELKALSSSRGFEPVEPPDFEGRMELARNDPALVEGVFGDPGILGELLEGRPGLMALLAEVKAGLVDTVLIRNTNRLSRRALVLHQILAVLEVRDHFRIITPNREYDCSDDNDLLLLGVFGAVDQNMKRWVVGTMLRAKASRRSRGTFVDSRMPYGYAWDKVNKRPVPIAGEVEVVREIFTLCVEQKLSPAAIAEELTRRGIHSQKPGSWWNSAGVRLLIGRPYYAGRWETAKGVLAVDPPAPIVDAQTWKAAQKTVAWWHYRASGPHVKRDFLLAKLIQCECGSIVTGREIRCRMRSDLARYRYYTCGRHLRHREQCDAMPVKAELLEKPVWGLIEGLARDPGTIEALLVSTQQDLLPKWRKELARTEKLLAGLAFDEDLASKAHLKQVFTLDRLEREMQEIAKERADLTERKQHLEALIEGEELRQQASDRVTREMAAVGDRLDSMSIGEKRDLLRRLGFRITVMADRSKATVEFAGAALWAAEGLSPALSHGGDGSWLGGMQ